jgi:lysophospholipase L1-like esterase
MAEAGGKDLAHHTIIANRLLILGDSLAMGAAEVSNTDVTRFISPAYPDLLRTLFPQLDIVMTSGVRHDTNTAFRQLPQLLELHRPAVVLVAVGGSDCDVDWRKVILSKGKHSRSRVSLGDYERNLRSIVATTKAAEAKPILIEGTSSSLAMRGIYLGHLSGLDVNAMIAAGGGQEANDLRVESYRATVRRVAAELQADIVACPNDLVTEDPQTIFTADGVHLSVVAQRLLAAAYANAIRRAFDLRDDSAVA